MADLTAPPPAAPVADPPPPAAPAADPAPAAATDTPPADPPPAADPAEAKRIWKLQRKGQEVEISDEEEVRRLAQMGFDYTRKTQEVADYERRLRDEAQKLVTHFSNADNLRAALAALERATPAPPPPSDPNDVPTVQTVQTLIASEVAAARAQLQREQLEAETARYTQEYTAEVDTTLKSLITDKFPRLGDVDKIEKLIMDDVSEEVAARVAADPRKVVPMGEVKAMIVASATRRHDKLTARDKEHEKMRLVREAKLTTKGTEPPGGAAAPPAASTKPMKLGSKDLTAAVTAELQAAFSKK